MPHSASTQRPIKSRVIVPAWHGPVDQKPGFAGVCGTVSATHPSNSSCSAYRPLSSRKLAYFPTHREPPGSSSQAFRAFRGHLAMRVSARFRPHPVSPRTSVLPVMWIFDSYGSPLILDEGGHVADSTSLFDCSSPRAPLKITGVEQARLFDGSGPVCPPNRPCFAHHQDGR